MAGCSPAGEGAGEWWGEGLWWHFGDNISKNGLSLGIDMIGFEVWRTCWVKKTLSRMGRRGDGGEERLVVQVETVIFDGGEWICRGLTSVVL